MTQNKAAVSTAVALTVLLAWTAADAQTVVLRHKFVTNQQLAYQFWEEGAATVSVTDLPGPGNGEEGPSGLQMRFDVNGRLVADVESVDGQGNGTLHLQIGRLGMQMEGMDKSFHLTIDPDRGIIEADGKSNELAASGVQQLLRWWENCSVTISPRGKLLDIRGAQQMLSGNRLTQMPMMLQPGAWHKLAEIMPPWLPKSPVSVGDSWGTQMGAARPAKGVPKLPELNVEYTLERIGEIDGNTIARIGFVASVTHTDISAAMAPDLRQQKHRWANNMQIAVDEELSGTLYFDVDRGQLRSARGDVNIGIRVDRETERESESAKPTVSFGTQMNLHFEVSSEQ